MSRTRSRTPTCQRRLSVFDAATALDTAMDMADPQPTLVELLVRHVLLPREFLPQIGINSSICDRIKKSRHPRSHRERCPQVYASGL